MGKSKFGWCASGHDELCRVSFIDWNKVEQFCSCECHVEESTEG